MSDSIILIVLFAWIPVIFTLCMVLPPRRAVLTAFLFAWLFLPVASIKFAAGIPAYDKMSATCVGIMAAAILFDLPRIATLRPSWFDIPVIVWCVCPFASSMSNDLGPYDGLSAAFKQTVAWGMPYFIGRVYFRDAEALRELAIGLFIGGLIYVPLCLIELRMSPQLHNWVYGNQQSSFVQTLRLGGWRPMVFMSHGLMVGMWMCMTALIGVWLWFSGSMKLLHRVPVIFPVVALLCTAVLCKSTGAILLLALGLAVIFTCYRLNTRALVFALIALAPLYMFTRGTGAWNGGELADTAHAFVGYERARSLEFRLRNETMLAEHALNRPYFGWGGWGRNRVFDKYHRDLSVTDGLWIITLGVNGIVGLASWTIMMLMPVVAVMLRLPTALWRTARAGPAIVIALVVVLYVLDCIPNAMTNPIFMLCTGALVSLAILPAAAAAPSSIVACAGGPWNRAVRV